MELLPLLLVLLLFVVPPMLLMRTQRRRAQQVADMRSSIAVGDRIVTVSGVHATVVGVGEGTFDAEIAPGVAVRLEQAGVMRVEKSPES